MVMILMMMIIIMMLMMIMMTTQSRQFTLHFFDIKMQPIADIFAYIRQVGCKEEVQLVSDLISDRIRILMYQTNNSRAMQRSTA